MSTVNSQHYLGLSIREHIEKATITERIALLNNLYNKWIVSYDNIISKFGQNPTFFDFINLSLDNFNLDKNNIQMGSFEKAKLTCITELIYLKLFFDIDNLGEMEEQRITLTMKFNKIFRAIIDAENALRNALHLQNSMIETDIGEGEILDITRFSPMDTSNNTPYQNFLLFLLENLMRKGYRRYLNDCYEKIYTDKGYDTHTWKYKMDLKQFIFEIVRKETHYEMWQNLTNAKDNVRAAVQFLQDYKGGEFEDIKKDRNVFAFNNGIYFTCSKNLGMNVDEWVSYENTDNNYKKIGSSVIACNYFNLEFDDSPFNANAQKTKKKDWFNIIKTNCKSFKSIMDYQEWDEDVQRWLCIFIGRLLYNVGELDNWQVIPYLLGQAGSGKSTVINFIANKIYDKGDIGTMSNNIEHTFGLQALYNKLVFVAPEIKANFRLEQSEFQTLVSGESMSIAVKNQSAKTVNWTVPGIMAGNEVPQYSDNAGSISRRIVVFLFNKKVKKGDTLLGSKIEKEISHIILACNRAYLEKVNNAGSEDIWTLLPKYFIDSRDEMAETTNALTAFLKSDRCVLGAQNEHFTRESVFIEQFSLFCKETNFGKPRWNRQYCMGPFSTYDIKIVGNARETDKIEKKKITGTYFYGVEVVYDKENKKNYMGEGMEEFVENEE